MKISFHGAARSVTGSRHLLEAGGARILLDCGLFQGRREESEQRNRKFDFDPLEYVCHSLGIPYFQEPVYADILWNDHLFTFYTQHGRSGSLTEGGKINAAMRPLEYQEHVMFTFYAHVHDAKTTRPTRIVRDRENFKLVLKKQYVVICPAFLNYFGSYASKMALKPGAWGTIACEMYANGDYHAST